MEAMACTRATLRTAIFGRFSHRCGGAESASTFAAPGWSKSTCQAGPAATQGQDAVKGRPTGQVMTRIGVSHTLAKGSRQRRTSVACQAVRETSGKASAEGLKFAVVVARFNDFITKLLLEGAKETFRRHGAADEDIEIVWVPGSFELPVVATAMAKSGEFDAVLCIGAVIRGATTHYEAVVNGATSGILAASAATGVPVIFGVLTCDTMEQAIDRAGGKAGNKGGECAATAVEMGALLRDLRQKKLAAPAWLDVFE